MGNCRGDSCISFNGNILIVDFPMRIVSILENRNFEKRIAITPEIAKKYIALGCELSLTENYGEHLGFRDKEYKELGVKISKDEKEIINSADVIVQLGLLLR